MTGQPGDDVFRSELMAAISLAVDIGMAQPLETGLAVCLVAVSLSERLGLEDEVRQRVYHLALLQHIGCTAAATDVAAVMGDEMVMRSHAATLDFADRRQMLGFLLGHVARANAPLARPAALLRALSHARAVTNSVNDVCAAARMLAARFGYDAAFQDDLGCVYEYWDGSGFPGRVGGEGISLPTQVVQVATLAVAGNRLGGVHGATRLVQSRRGHSLAPNVATAFLTAPTRLLAAIGEPDSLWLRVIAGEPVPQPGPTAAGVDDMLRVVADFVDLKSPYLTGHSSGVASLAGAAAERWSLSADEVRAVRRAGWVHDIGRIGVSARVWGHSGPLSADDWERVRLHPYFTDRVLDRTEFLRRLGAVASGHHERLDGSGYFRGASLPQLSRGARVLAAADAFHAMTEPRPHRPALSSDAAAAQVREEVAAGRLDGDAAEAVLVAAGLRRERAKGSSVAGLTPRELETLSHVARGLSIKQIARVLGISPKTVDGHIQRIYAKIGVSTRAGATLYAMQHNLVVAGRQDREISP